MINTIERMTQVKDAMVKGLKVATGNTYNFREYKDNNLTYSIIHSTENLKPVNIQIDISIFMDSSFIKEYDLENIKYIEYLPEMPDELKMALSMYGIFAWVKIICDRKLTEKEILELKDLNICDNIRDTIRMVSRREIPIITASYDNINTGFFFSKFMLKNPCNIDETIFIIGDHGENTLQLIDSLKIASRRLYDFKFISSHSYLINELEGLEHNPPQYAY